MDKKKQVFSYILTALFGLCIFFLIITFSIGLPIYCRFFYYAHINCLDLEKSTGFSYAQIREGYDQVLDYLILNKPFGTGIFAYSQEGMSHFADVRVLFNINLSVFLASLAIMIIILILKKFNVISLVKPKGFFVGFYSAISIFAVAVILGILVAINPDNAFVVFHKIFFPGKDNWVFNSSKDQIIKVLPQEFFINCAILIGASIVIISTAIIILSAVLRHKRNKK